MANAAQQVMQNDLLRTSVDIDPVAVVYNVTNDQVESFVYDYLTKTKKIAGVEAVRLRVDHEGSQRPELSIYAFFNLNSENIISGLTRVPVHLRDKVDIGGLRADEALFNALKPLVRGGEFKLHSRPSQGLAYIRLDVFKTFGLMLAANPNLHMLTILEAQKLKKNRSVVSVMKRTRMVEQEDITDRFNRIIQDIED